MIFSAFNPRSPLSPQPALQQSRLAREPYSVLPTRMAMLGMAPHSHSIVPGGFDVITVTVHLTPLST